MVNRYNRFFPNYPDDSDFTTNAPSYYEDLAHKNKLIKLLAKRIWEYENTLNESLEAIEKRLTDYITENDSLMNERLENWDKRIDELDEEVSHIFVEWLNDGTLEQIINHDVLGNKADKDYVDALNENVTAQLAQIAINVKDFGAVGDGVTDDTLAIQEAIDYAHLNGYKEVIIPYTENHYLLTNTINLKSNMKIKGNDTVLFTPSRDNVIHLFTLENTENIVFEGFSLRSVSDKEKTDGREGLTSNVYCFLIVNSDNIEFNHLDIQHFGHVLNFKYNEVSDLSRNISIKNIRMKNVHMAIYLSFVENVSIENIVIDREGSPDKLDHHFYVNSGSTKVFAEKITMINGGGTAVIIKNDLAGFPCNFIEFRDANLLNVGSGFSVGSGVGHSFKDIRGEGAIVNENDGYWVRVIDSEVDISNFSFKGQMDMFLYIDGDTSVTVANGNVKNIRKTCLTLVNFKEVVINNVVFPNATPLEVGARFLYIVDNGLYDTFIFKNNLVIFEDNIGSTQPISIRSEGALCLFDNNFFDVRGTIERTIFRNTVFTPIISNNLYKGTDALTEAGDYKLFDNINVS